MVYQTIMNIQYPSKYRTPIGEGHLQSSNTNQSIQLGKKEIYLHISFL